MRRRLPLFAAACVALTIFSAGCTERGGKTPRETWELSIRYVENEEYGKLWSLFTRRFKRELGEMFAEQKKTVLREKQENGGYSEQTRTSIESQYGMGVGAFLAASDRDLHARMVEIGRDRILRMKLQGAPEVTGDRAKLNVVLDDPGVPPTTFDLVKEGDRWLIDGTENVRRRR